MHDIRCCNTLLTTTLTKHHGGSGMGLLQAVKGYVAGDTNLLWVCHNPGLSHAQYALGKPDEK